MPTNRYLGKDPILTNLALAYTNAEFVAERLLPTSPVASQSGQIWEFDRGRFRPSKNDGVRAEGANSEEERYNFKLGQTFNTVDHAKRVFVPDSDVDNARVTGRDPFEDATEHVVDRQLVDREVQAASLLTDTSNYATNHSEALSSTDLWDDFDNSTPIEDVRDAMQTVHQKIFRMPNRILLSQPVFNVLQDHPKFLERAKYTGQDVTAALMARIWNVDEVIVAGAGKNTSDAGQTDSMDYVWGKNVIISFTNPSQADKVLTQARTYQWAAKSPAVERLRGSDEEDRKGTYVRRGDWYYDKKVVSDEAGYLIQTAVS